MDAGDPFETQRVATTVTAELSAAGFEDAHEIGRGGFGVVYRCTQPTLDRTVAVKVLTADLDEENRARFFREQRAMGRLTGHPNIVSALHVGTTDSGRPYLVMPYHPQDCLDARIRRHGPLPLEDALRLGVKMAGAVESAHRIGILHRDVKPSNILLTDYGEPALTDFGIAHVAGGFETATGTVTGSPAFTAPEVLSGGPPSPASDIYSLGATVFCAVTGHAAFERRSGEHLVAQFLRITTEPVPDLRDHGIPDDVSEVIERAMAADPRERPAADEFGDTLRWIQLAHGLPVDEMALPGEPGGTRRGRDPARTRPQPAQTTAGRATPSTVPALRVSVGCLPLELTSFVGRRNELTEAKNLLSVSRLVTLTGIGGVGKTRLALRVAADVRRGFADGVRWVELGELQDGSLVVDMVAAALGIRDRSARRLDDVVAEFLGPRHLLLILDNCEQVVDAAAALAETLLRSCPELRILTTSREPLTLGGEAVLRVPPLTAPDPDRPPTLRGLPRYDAITLFTQRAAAAVPGFEITEDNRVTVARICRRLDGLPLPIELAAARLRAMSPEQILQRLTDRYTLLTRGNRGAPTRQQTLRLSIDWSHDLCTPAEQQLWARLSVFAGSVELDAAEDVCATDPAEGDLLDVVTSLVDKSILIREDAGPVVRFRMLETLRDYGREKSEQSGEHSVLRRRHRDWYQQLVLRAQAEWISPRQREWIARLEREQPNLREAMEFCLSEPGADTTAGLRIAAALFQFWLSRGLLSEGRHWLDRALAHRPGQPATARVDALYADSVLAGLQGEIASATARVEEARALAEQMTDPVVHARVAHAGGLLALFSGDLPHACTRLEEAVEAFGARGNLSDRVWTLMTLGLAYELQGDGPRAITCHQRALDTTEAHGESVFRSYSLWAMGVAVWQQGDRGRAVRLLEQCLRLTRLVDEPLTAAVALEALAWIAADQDNARRAAVLLGAAEALGRSVGSSPVLYPNLLTHHEDCERLTRRALGERAFEAARREGAAQGFDAAVAYALGEDTPAPAPPAGPTTTSLTKRERQVAELVSQGMTNKAIANQLVISQRTAQGHVEHILTKLGFTSRAQIAAWIVEHTQGERA
ncbi:protein kinase domain-containing protein [Rhodococcus sp. T7]|uniref:protein kinase domain-containing protein n=1 Tax=Rhodococcus sp. T7 TaxID=627444 RepID=UPI00135799E6|nr:protein kinase [Rhodococcus sp. T7]KAF0957257.1 Serine/threonine-protein kinase PknD [Rhodococcus sp. T7]KAF0966717.1 Serine/threonine-protein kinase PknD [Rhodococcus sp. T7]